MKKNLILLKIQSKKLYFTNNSLLKIRYFQKSLLGGVGGGLYRPTLEWFEICKLKGYIR